MNKYIFASSNQNKLLEISTQLSDITLLSLLDVGYYDEIIESGSTLRENALIKSKTIYDKYSIPTIADDTGLEVYQLDGRPGVFSARYSGEKANATDNIKKVLDEMQDITDRRARFKTVICLKSKSQEIFFEGIVEGCISNESSGDGGFGYDPIFIPNGCQKTFGEMSLDEKNKISHRSRAIQKVVDYLNI